VAEAANETTTSEKPGDDSMNADELFKSAYGLLDEGAALLCAHAHVANNDTIKLHVKAVFAWRAQYRAAKEAPAPAWCADRETHMHSQYDAIRAAVTGVAAGELALRPEVARFAQDMEQQLRANDHKPGWQRDEWQALLKRLREETSELKDAIYAARTTDVEAPAAPRLRASVRKEAADVANFAMMLAENEGVTAVDCSGEAAPGAAKATKPETGGAR
jgi:NTP pyrophosphatase (non-canonical NTP hydrolase)